MKTVFEDKEEAKFEMAPMIDMVFLLLVFFMCASHLTREQKLKLDIPIASKGVVPKERPDRWIVNITKDGTLYSGNMEVELKTLKDILKVKVEENPNQKIYLRADADTHHKEVKAVMNAMAEVGIDGFIFGVYTPGS
jgi:biopolymer transport protein ExbD